MHSSVRYLREYKHSAAALYLREYKHSSVLYLREYAQFSSLLKRICTVQFFVEENNNIKYFLAFAVPTFDLNNPIF